MTRKRFVRAFSLLIVLAMLLASSASAMTTQNNIGPLSSHRDLTKGNSSSLEKNLQKLSSGYRISRAGDDAVKPEIREQMPAEAQAMLSRMAELGLKSGWELTDSGWRYSVGSLDDSSMAVGSSGGDGSAMALFTTRTSAGYDFDQFATDGSDAIIGSDNPSAVMVGPKGEIGIVGTGKAFVGLFDGEGKPCGGWTLVTDGNNLFVETGGGLQIVRDGQPIQSLTLSPGSTAELDVQASQPTEVLVEEQPSGEAGVYLLEQPLLEHAIYNLEVSAENITGAESEIRSVDIAEEVNRSARQNILTQMAENMPELPQ